MRSLLDFHKWKRNKGSRWNAACSAFGLEAQCWIRQQHDSAINIQDCADALGFHRPLAEFQALCFGQAVGDVLEGTKAWINPFYQEIEELAAGLGSHPYVARNQKATNAKRPPKTKRRPLREALTSVDSQPSTEL
jgi:hypothetical protein